MQNMGWTANNSLWLATRGGDVFFSPTPGVSEKFDQARLGSRGFGILDVACAPRSIADCALRVMHLKAVQAGVLCSQQLASNALGRTWTCIGACCQAASSP